MSEMDISRREAYRILEISDGASHDEIRSAYKRQALRWHPDKHKNSPEATKKFQEISSAYERLTKPEAMEISLSMEEMFDLFAHVFCGARVATRRGFYSNGFSFADSDSDDADIYIFKPEHFRESHREKPTTREREKPSSREKEFAFREREKASSREKDVPTSDRPTVSEAQRHQDELLREEEKQKKLKEKRKERKKRRKAKKKQEKEVRYGGGDGKKKGKKEVLLESSDEEDDDENVDDVDDMDESENKENVQTNENDGTSVDPPQIDKSSKVKPVNDSEHKVAEPTINNDSKSHEEAESNHRKEVHDGHQGGGGVGVSVSGGGREGGGAGGDGAGVKEARKAQHKTKKSAPNPNVYTAGMSDSESDEETQGLDMNSAFFARAASGIAKKQTTPPVGKTKKKSKGKKEESESIEDMDPQILESRKLAVRGNEMANTGNYQSAVKFFTKAIDLNPMDFRFFGNRSFCFDHLRMYDHALRDAEQAISLDKTWPKGYYRKGRALSGLKLFTDAEAAFEQVLKLDKNCAEAVQELRTVRVYRLMEMGFGAQQSEAAILQFGTVPAALENLLSQGGDLPINGEMEEVYVSDEEDFINRTIQESKLDCRNPENLRSLWIGNLQPTVSEKELKDLFKTYGEVVSMRRMPEKFCAFVNFKDPRMASKAMDRLQGQELHGKHLLIKFPDNPIDQHQGTAPAQNQQQEYVDLRFKTMILRKNQSQGSANKKKNEPLPKQPPNHSVDPASKMTGPVNGDECFFWRTTGCWYAERCRYKHLPQSKGLDKK